MTEARRSCHWWTTILVTACLVGLFGRVWNVLKCSNRSNWWCFTFIEDYEDDLHHYTSLPTPAKDPETGVHQRTILSVIDPITRDYVNGWSHPLSFLWKELETSNITFYQATGPPLERGLSLHLDKSELSRIGDSVILSWSSASTSTTISNQVWEDDLIALYCGSTLIDAATIAQARATSKWHWREHYHGTNDNMPFTNSWYIPQFPSSIREKSCKFVLLRMETNPKNPTFNTSTLAISPTLTTDPNTKTPTHLHLALTSNPSEVIIQFTTGDEGTPVAMYGKKESLTGKDKKVKGTSKTYTAQDLCGAPANITSDPGHFVPPGQLHTVVLTNLEPDTLYHYQVGIALGQGIVWSDEIYPFRSPPSSTWIDSGEQPEPYSFIVYGEQGAPTLGWGKGSAWTTTAISRLISNGHDMDDQWLQGSWYHHHDHSKHHDNDSAIHNGHSPVIRAVHHIGGLSFARGAAHVWDEWFSLVQLFAARIPLMIAVGGAEYDYVGDEGFGKDPSGRNHSYQPSWGNYGKESGGECGVPVSQRFQMPITISEDGNESTSSNGVFWYSYDSGPWLHTIVLSSEHDLTPTSTQYQWLTEDLAGINRTSTPWVVMELSRPLYMNQARWGDNGVGLALRRSLEPLLRDKVDLVVSSHYHSYFRSCPGLFQSRCHNSGPMHITIGTAGAKPHLEEHYKAAWAAMTLQNRYGYGRINIYNASALEFQWVEVGPDNETGSSEVLDHYWMFK